MTAHPRPGPDGWIHRLAPTGAGPAHPPASSERTVAEATEALGEEPVAWAVDLGHRLAEVITRELPELGEGPDLFRTLRMGTESVVLQALLLLTGRQVSAGATEEALLGDREFARRRVGLDKVLRGIRVSHAELSRALMSACQELAPAAEHARQFRRISEALLAYVEDFASGMTAEYLAEHDRWVASGAAAREETVRQILGGEPLREETATRALGYPLRGRHLALVVWHDTELAAPTTDLQQAAAHFLRRRHCTTTLLVPTGRTSLWAWGAPAPAAAGADDEQPGPLDLPGIRIACGTRREGLSGFRRSHQEAEAAARVMRLSPRTDPVVGYPDVALASLLSADLTATRRFVHDELAGLAADTPQADQLRETLRHYLRSERSLVVSAARLHVARNTVTYRVKRAQELMGHDVAARLPEVLAALEAAHALGAAVLGPVRGGQPHGPASLPS
ncbi:PucR family transcriptional regulator [Streptomyces sp. NPDC093094]|uniref:PucR family transcriptional regulator n=1 Tax=Streptomyces sp. NPDC093094 TaxID=3366026 RepID=UPI00380F276A